MGRIFAVVAATGVTLLVLGFLTLNRRDTGTLVPPPEGVAEGFVRQLATSRVRQTRQYLSRNARASLSPERLAAWFGDLEAAVGFVQTIECEISRVSGDSADALVVVMGEIKSIALTFHLVREHGLWVVSELPAVTSGFSRKAVCGPTLLNSTGPAVRVIRTR